MNRYCEDVTDVKGCLCRLSSATIYFIDDQNVVIASQYVGDNTCGQPELAFELSRTCQPSPMPSAFPSSSPTVCLPKASKVKIVGTPSTNLNFFAVHVYPFGSAEDVAMNKIASQSSTFRDNTSRFGASRAVDGLNRLFSFTKRSPFNFSTTTSCARTCFLLFPCSKSWCSTFC